MMPPLEAVLRFPGHAPLLADHFPGAPRVPGSCLLEAMRRAVEEAFPSRRVHAVRRARFRHFVLPDSDLLCRMEPEDRGDALPSEVCCTALPAWPKPCSLWSEGRPSYFQGDLAEGDEGCFGEKRPFPPSGASISPQKTSFRSLAGRALRRADARLPVSRFCRGLDGPHARRRIFRPYPGLSMAWRRPCAAGPLRPGRFFFTMRPCD